MLTNEWRKTNSYHVLYEELARVEEQEMKLKDLNLDWCENIVKKILKR